MLPICCFWTNRCCMKYRESRHHAGWSNSSGQQSHCTQDVMSSFAMSKVLALQHSGATAALMTLISYRQLKPNTGLGVVASWKMLKQTSHNHRLLDNIGPTQIHSHRQSCLVHPLLIFASGCETKTQAEATDAQEPLQHTLISKILDTFMSWALADARPQGSAERHITTACHVPKWVKLWVSGSNCHPKHDMECQPVLKCRTSANYVTQI